VEKFTNLQKIKKLFKKFIFDKILYSFFYTIIYLLR